MKQLHALFRFLAGTKFLIGLCIVLSFISVLGVIFSLQTAGTFFGYLINNNVLSYESIQSIQNFAIQDNQRAYWFIFCIVIGLILSGYGFIEAVKKHEITGTGTGAGKLIYLGLLLIFATGIIDAAFGFKGTSVLQKGSELYSVTAQNGEVRLTTFSLKLQNIITEADGSSEDKVKMTILEGDSQSETILKPWVPLNQGLYTMYYYGVQNAQPLITFYVKSLVDILKEPVLLGLQVGSKIENKKEQVSFQVTDFNMPHAPLILTDKTVDGFKNEGRSADYILRYKDTDAWLRTFEHYPHMLAVNDGKGNFVQIPFGLSISSKTGWDVLYEYRDYLAKNNLKNKKEVIQHLPALKRYSEVLKPVIQSQVLKASSALDLFNLPYLLQMDQVYPLKQITLNVHYEPGIYLSYLGLFFLVAGLFVSFVFSRGRKQ